MTEWLPMDSSIKPSISARVVIQAISIPRISLSHPPMHPSDALSMPAQGDNKMKREWLFHDNSSS
jgi:hypothetical protein